MSLLIPTQQDYKDARQGYERLPVYKEKHDQLVKQGKIKWKFEVVPGFFKQSDNDTDDLQFNYATNDFGIMKPWNQIIDELNQLNGSSDEKYKLLFLARHGQGYHNVVVSKYGSEAWRNKWHNLGVDGDIIYGPDPELTPLGISQAEENNQVWHQQVKNGCPVPTKYYASPLQRSSMTMVVSMKDIWPENRQVIVSEKIREIIGFHLCNKRSSKDTILERFGKYGFETEDGFSEVDELYNDEEETFDDNCIRVESFLEDLWEVDDKVINVTSHGGTIKCFLAVLGHRNFTISTGGMIPVVVKGSRVNS
ncbi:phosphomutase-like protein 3 [[Candida] jaroonii]|uniref:Phosphomutase-like protein 3 n=1 Tax=[Candida] jaroonii TaxID=467808 RepID=A0ACA9YA57_9ASCO|nr:phosphomutase-like protein 3 [[Candida] jaroonii]